jgi:hypothetical protein
VRERGRGSQRPSIIFNRCVFQIFEWWKSRATQTSSSYVHSLPRCGGIDLEVLPAEGFAGHVGADQRPLVHSDDLNSA